MEREVDENLIDWNTVHTIDEAVKAVQKVNADYAADMAAQGYERTSPGVWRSIGSEQDPEDL